MYSFDRAQKISLHSDLNEPELEILESFSSRFSRFSDIAISKYFRLLCLEADPAFRGSVADILNTAEKYQWVDSRATWMRIRELRSLAAHEYSPSEFKSLYEELIAQTPTLLKVRLDL